MLGLSQGCGISGISCLLLGLLVMKSEGLCSSSSSFIPSTVPGLTSFFFFLRKFVSFFFTKFVFFFLMKNLLVKQIWQIYIFIFVFWWALRIVVGSLCTLSGSGVLPAQVAYKPACLNPASDPFFLWPLCLCGASSFLRLVPVSVWHSVVRPWKSLRKFSLEMLLALKRYLLCLSLILTLLLISPFYPFSLSRHFLFKNRVPPCSL